MLTLARAKVAFQGLPSMEPNFGYPLRNWKEAVGKSGLPAIGLKLNDLVNRLQVSSVLLFENNRFSNCLRNFLLVLGLLSVNKQREI